MVGAKLANIEVGSTGGRGKIDSANLQGQTRSEAAQLLTVSERSVNTPKKVEQNATPGLIEKVEQGSVYVSAAADVSELPKVEQIEIVANKQRFLLSKFM